MKFATILLLAVSLVPLVQVHAKEARTTVEKRNARCESTVKVCKRSWRHLWQRHCQDKCAYTVEILLAK